MNIYPQSSPVTAKPVPGSPSKTAVCRARAWGTSDGRVSWRSPAIFQRASTDQLQQHTVETCWNPINNGIQNIYQLVQDFLHPQYVGYKCDWPSLGPWENWWKLAAQARGRPTWAPEELTLCPTRPRSNSCLKSGTLASMWGSTVQSPLQAPWL
jgi:hypothetical protein